MLLFGISMILDTLDYGDGADVEIVGLFIILLPSEYFEAFYWMMLMRSSDYEGKRQGNRVVSLGEIPYFDALSKSRRQALGEA